MALPAGKFAVVCERDWPYAKAIASALTDKGICGGAGLAGARVLKKQAFRRTLAKPEALAKYRMHCGRGHMSSNR